MSLPVSEVVFGDYPDVTFRLNDKKIGAELTEIFDERDQDEIKTIKKGGEVPGYSFDPADITKIEKCLNNKLKKDYSLPGHEIWMVCYTNHVGEPFWDHYPEVSEKIISFCKNFLKQKKDLDRIIVFEKLTNKVVANVSKK
jgi:hypothetical protein